MSTASGTHTSGPHSSDPDRSQPDRSESPRAESPRADIESDSEGDGEATESWDRPRQAWLLSGDCRGARQRTLLLEMATRSLFPIVLVFSVYLLLVGHYGPGGGFAAGLVAGLAFVLRYVAGGTGDSGAAVRVRPPVLIGSGLVVALLSALLPATWGDAVLSSYRLAVSAPVLGEVSVQTNLFLDVGVYLLIIGVVLDLLRSLGAGIERDMDDAGEVH